MGRRVKEQMSIAIVALFEKSSLCELKIVIAHTVGSTVTLTTLGSVTRDGTNFTPSPALRQMLKTNGLKATEVTKENGNEF
jgi:hypothetical protein